MTNQARRREGRPTLSICIPSFNRAELLSVLLTEIDTPDLLPFPCEIIVIDNASPDPRYREIAGYQARHFTYRYLRRNENIGAVRNVTASYGLARGEFCLHLCDDDRLIWSEVATIVEEMRAEPSIVATYAAWEMFDQVDRAVVESHRFDDLTIGADDRALFVERLLGWSLSIPENAVFRTDAVARAAFSMPVNYFCFTLLRRLLAFGAVRFSSRPFYRLTTDRVRDLKRGGRVSSNFGFAGWTSMARGFALFYHWATGRRLYALEAGREQMMFLQLTRNAVYEAQNQGRLAEALETLDYLKSIADVEMVTADYDATLRFLAAIDEVRIASETLPGVDRLVLVGLDPDADHLVRETITRSAVGLRLESAPYAIGLDPAGCAFLTLSDLARNQIIQLHGMPPGYVFSLESLKLTFGF